MLLLLTPHCLLNIFKMSILGFPREFIDNIINYFYFKFVRLNVSFHILSRLEKMIIANETKMHNPSTFVSIKNIFKEKVKVQLVNHKELKKLSKNVKAPRFFWNPESWFPFLRTFLGKELIFSERKCWL